MFGLPAFSTCLLDIRTLDESVELPTPIYRAFQQFSIMGLGMVEHLLNPR